MGFEITPEISDNELAQTIGLYPQYFQKDLEVFKDLVRRWDHFPWRPQSKPSECMTVPSMNYFCSNRYLDLTLDPEYFGDEYTK